MEITGWRLQVGDYRLISNIITGWRLQVGDYKLHNLCLVQTSSRAGHQSSDKRGTHPSKDVKDLTNIIITPSSN